MVKGTISWGGVMTDEIAGRTSQHQYEQIQLLNSLGCGDMADRATRNRLFGMLSAEVDEKC